MQLVPGSYIITYNEIVHLPNNIMALGRPRSSCCAAALPYTRRSGMQAISSLTVAYGSPQPVRIPASAERQRNAARFLPSDRRDRRLSWSLSGRERQIEFKFEILKIKITD